MVIEDVGDTIYNIEKNEISFSGFRLYHGPSLEINDNENLIDFCNDLDKYKDEVARGEYKITYLGNNKFSDVENISYTTIGEGNYCN